jgi:hypothetical protein
MSSRADVRFGSLAHIAACLRDVRRPLVDSPSLMPPETSTLKKSAEVEGRVEADEAKSPNGKSVALAAPEHRKGGKPAAD